MPKEAKYRQFAILAAVFFIGLLAPAFFVFFRSLWNDPAVPKIRAAVADAAKQRFLSYLGPGKKLAAQAMGQETKES